MRIDQRHELHDRRLAAGLDRAVHRYQRVADHEHRLQQKTASPNGYRITEGSGTSSLSFRPAGMAATPASMTVCRSTPTAGNQERVVTLEGSGRVTVKRTSTGTCS
ncbi:MAG: GspH/FimT family pseudopilin [Burkholderiaceae bacterium]